MSVEIRDDAARRRYEALADGEVAGFLDYTLRDGVIILVHTEVDPAYGGRGIGADLARGALDDARARQLQVVPRCPFVTAWLRRHPAYHDLLVAG